MKATFTPLERLENAIRTYKSDGEIHDLDPAFPPPELKVEPKDILEVVTQLRQSQVLLSGLWEAMPDIMVNFTDDKRKLLLDVKKLLNQL